MIYVHLKPLLHIFVDAFRCSLQTSDIYCSGAIIYIMIASNIANIRDIRPKNRVSSFIIVFHSQLFFFLYFIVCKEM